MTDREYMAETIRQAAMGKARGNLPFGAIVVRDGEIVGKGFSKEIEKSDVTAHAEIEALSEACKKLSKYELDDCVIFASGEPCTMCASAIFQAKIPKIFIAAKRNDLPHVFRKRKIDIFSLAKDSSYRPTITTGLLKEESIALFSDIKR
jgi:tRNA(adenine34) deaminase